MPWQRPHFILASYQYFLKPTKSNFVIYQYFEYIFRKVSKYIKKYVFVYVLYTELCIESHGDIPNINLYIKTHKHTNNTNTLLEDTSKKTNNMSES